MAGEKRPLKVFLCHTSADKPAVRELYQRLSDEGGIDPWLDTEKLLPGQHWKSVIKQALYSADSVIIFISNKSIDKEGFVQREMNYAWDLSLEKPKHAIYLIPVRLDDCEVPDDLQEKQWVDYFGDKKEETYQKLIKSLRLRHEQKIKSEAIENKPQKKNVNEQDSIVVRSSLSAVEEKYANSQVGQNIHGKNDVLRNYAPIFFRIAIVSIVGIFLFWGFQQIFSKNNNIFNGKTPTVATQESIGFSETPIENTPELITSATQTILATLSIVMPTQSEETIDRNRVRVSAGDFIMGTSQTMQTEMLALCNNCNVESVADQSPQRNVYLDDFWIDKTEVTIDQFRQFVEDANYVTTAERKGSSLLFNRLTKKYTTTKNVNWKRPEGEPIDLVQYGSYPVTHVSWNDAKAYCNWIGGYLPTEAEWEKAARWVDGRFFPWGNLIPDNKYLNFDLQNSGPVEVMSYPDGVSKYGVYDMSGNVWEWVNDWYAESYIVDETENPKGALSGDGHIFRGGSWASEFRVELVNVMTTYRAFNKSDWTSPIIGFRCVYSTP